MRALFHFPFLLLLACGLAGCFDNRPINRVDGGPVVVPRDAGPIDPPMDSGGIILQDSGPVCVPESTASACTDFADNDCDLAIDCNDISCCSAVTCATGTLCGNMRVDAGVDAGRDAGRDSGTGTCPPVTFPSALTAGCLPRCAVSTISAFNACETPECRTSALASDPTPSISTTVNGTPVTLDCEYCVNYQTNACAYTYCPTQYMSLATCDETTDFDACEGETTTLQTCLDASSGFTTCYEREATACFG